jgi:regulator of PEP synthase PpsR (kinase-PPPase family)
MTQFHLHLVSDATGETLNSVAKAALVQFEEAEAIEHLWTLVRSQRQLDAVVEGLEAHPGVVFFTLVSEELRNNLERHCGRLQIPCISVLDPIFEVLSRHLGATSRAQPGRQHKMNAEYFSRIDALAFSMQHDDGQMTEQLKDADVVLVGVSRTSKTPTCIYLANRGVKSANVPVVPGCPLPRELSTLTGPLVVGLTTSPDRLVQIRRNRLLSLNQSPETDYVDLEVIKEEVAFARKLFARNDWPVIDVTRRSIEETAAAVLNLLSRRSEA